MMLPALLVASVLSQPRPEPVDVSAFQAQLKVLTDGKGHYVVYDSRAPYSTMFYGDEKTLVQLRVPGGGRSGTESWNASLWDPRIPHVDGNFAAVDMKDSGRLYQVTCGKRVTPLTEVGAQPAEKLLATAAFVKPSWDRMPERLLRDDKGSYYLVDRLRTEDRLDRRDFRLFVGPRGKMKQLPLKDIVDDSEGMIFSTKNGELRLVFGSVGRSTDDKPVKEEFRWIEGKKVAQLTDVPLDVPMNARLVYLDLGPYVGQRLGTPCDDLM